MLEKIDRNGDGQASFDEYITYTFGYAAEDLDRLSKDQTTDAKNLISKTDKYLEEYEVTKFKEIDTDGNGLIDTEELISHYKKSKFYCLNNMPQSWEVDTINGTKLIPLHLSDSCSRLPLLNFVTCS
ncbi:unnamed protein product [Dibothriocephalus latus]|uniref:EF-hand domain-containing protein n=1 Tax=Dibothriocephalus latus TaxID=60516 RepID=A0A3P7NV58_DIBLA|nr:unnamed protein product [Dibothriocephalus latus]